MLPYQLGITIAFIITLLWVTGACMPLFLRSQKARIPILRHQNPMRAKPKVTRINAEVIARSLRRSNLEMQTKSQTGLLRCARNDGRKQHEIARSSRAMTNSRLSPRPSVLLDTRVGSGAAYPTNSCHGWALRNKPVQNTQEISRETFKA